MAYRWKNDLTHDDVTPHNVFVNRRAVLAGMAAATAATALPTVGTAAVPVGEPNTWKRSRPTTTIMNSARAKLIPRKTRTN